MSTFTRSINHFLSGIVLSFKAYFSRKSLADLATSSGASNSAPPICHVATTSTRIFPVPPSISTTKMLSMTAMAAPRATKFGSKTTSSRVWQLLREHNANAFVLLCQDYESFSRFYPLSMRDVVEFPGVKITCEQVEVFCNGLLVVRDFSVVFSDQPKVSRHCKHYHHRGWPNHGVPETVESLVMLMRMLRLHARHVIVQCSDGKGRSGCIEFISEAVNVMPNEEATKEEILRAVREKIPGAVDTYFQMAFSIATAIHIVNPRGPMSEYERNLLESCNRTVDEREKRANWRGDKN